MKLYFAPKTRATRPRWMLEELGVPYELVTVDLEAKENRRPEYLRVHPLGQVPALVDGDVPSSSPSPSACTSRIGTRRRAWRRR